MRRVVRHVAAGALVGELPVVAGAGARAIGALPVGELPVVAGAYRASAVRGLSARELPVVARPDGARAARPALDVGRTHRLTAARVRGTTGPRPLRGEDCATGRPGPVN